MSDFFCSSSTSTIAFLTFLPGYRKYGTTVNASIPCFRHLLIPSSIYGGSTSRKQKSVKT